MLYSEIYNQLKSSFGEMKFYNEIESLGLKIRKRIFTSKPVYKEQFLGSQSEYEDYNIESNNEFNFYTFEDNKQNEPSGIIFLFHGLNEKKWEKYLPWACQLTKLTGKTVILFPLAFHMNRAPSHWSDSRLMQRLADERASKSTNSHSSFVNAALSERLESSPQRFFMSGLQTYNDFCELLKRIRAGCFTNISPDASIDLFGYSIGAFLSLLLLMDNPQNFLNDSRLFMFCGGATLDRTFPVSKYIVDKRAASSIASHYKHLADDQPGINDFFNSYFEKFSLSQSYFPGMMNYSRFKKMRQERLAKIGDRIHTIVLKNDDVIVPAEVINSLVGESTTVYPQIDVWDFDFPYNHVTPFPIQEKHNKKVDHSFKNIMEKAGIFLS